MVGTIPKANGILRVTVTGIGFDAVTMPQAVAWIRARALERSGAHFVCTGNLDHLAMLDRDLEFRSVYKAADLVIADGAPVVWLSRISASSGHPRLPERVAGSDLFWEIARLSHEDGIRLFFLGGSPGSANRAEEAVSRRFPNAKIAGIYCPPFESFSDPDEQERIIVTIQAADPDILLVGLGAPKQEKWIFANRETLGVSVSIGVGGTFEMAGGQVHRAPVWMRQGGLEWLYRFIQEPLRLWNRYFINDAPFLLRAVLRTLRHRLAGSNWEDTPAGQSGG